MTVLVFNCNGARARRTELAKRISENAPSIILLQETHLKPGIDFDPFPGYAIAARKDGTTYGQGEKVRGGVLTLIRDDIPYSAVALSETK